MGLFNIYKHQFSYNLFQISFRIANLELMADYGCEAWRVYNEVLQTLVNKLQNR